MQSHQIDGNVSGRWHLSKHSTSPRVRPTAPVGGATATNNAAFEFRALPVAAILFVSCGAMSATADHADFVCPSNSHPARTKIKMLPAANVQLTKVHYYDDAKNERNLEISTISRDVFREHLNKHTIIKRNVFGHKWVLKINECDEPVQKEKCGAKVVVYVWVFCCIVVAISFGVYFSLETTFTKNDSNATDVPKLSNQSESSANKTDGTHNKQRSVPMDNPVVNLTAKEIETLLKNASHQTTTSTICNECTADEVCLKTEDFASPLCVKIKDRNDPTGCGGLCQINMQHCKLLDNQAGLHQCSKNSRMLHCPDATFNCGNMCVAARKRCDGFIDCSNFQDEINCECDFRTHFRCGNETSCVENKKKCDGVIDCWDKSDEIDCRGIRGNFSCETHEAPCFDGTCIEKEQFCDGNFDCPDRSDEPPGC